MGTLLSDQLLADILRKVRPLIGKGKVANYIPALANIANQNLGISICTNDGQVYTAGDAYTRFTVQSISKVLSLTLVLTRYGDQALWSRVGKEPSGLPFNSLVQLELEQGRPRNPFINAGALVVCDMLQSCLDDPKQSMLQLVRELSGEVDINYDLEVAQSEFEHSDRNAAIAYLMRSFGNFKNDVLTVLDMYFHYCALTMNCVELAKSFIYLANHGHPLHSDKPLIKANHAKHINALLITSGMYDGAGEFAYRVGMPGKSGVGGGIVAVIPGEMSIAVWSPELDSVGNSIAGIAALEQLTQRLGRSIF